jgi:hypothetical protein
MKNFSILSVVTAGEATHSSIQGTNRVEVTHVHTYAEITVRIDCGFDWEHPFELLKKLRACAEINGEDKP